MEKPKTHIPQWLAELVAFAFELKARLFGGSLALSRESVRRLTTDRVFSTKKAEKLLGWKARIDPADGLSELIASIVAKK